MIFLIEYNRGDGRIVTIQEFDDSQRSEAEASRLEIEMALNRKGVGHEIVLLEAATRNALHQTHHRYFVGLDELLRSGSGQCAMDGHDSGVPLSGTRVVASVPDNPLHRTERRPARR